MNKASLTQDNQQVILVNAQDQPQGTATKLEAHQKNWCHRAYSVCLTRNDCAEILIQKRARGKYHCGGLWSNACCSHPAPGEVLAHSALARLSFEMGIQVPLVHVGSFYYQADLDSGLFEHEFDHVFHGVYLEETCVFNPTEVEETRWVPYDQLMDEIFTCPNDYTPWLKAVVMMVCKA